MSKRQAELRDRYTETERVVGLWRAKLKVGNQSFAVCYGTKRQAEWFRRMLAVALDRLVEEEGRKRCGM